MGIGVLWYATQCKYHVFSSVASFGMCSYIVNMQLPLTSQRPKNTTLVTFRVYCNMLHVIVVTCVGTFDVILNVACPLKFITYI